MWMGHSLRHHFLSPLAYIQVFKIHFCKKTMKIPGLSFSWKRAVGITKVKQKVARTTGIPTTKQGLERKIGSLILGTAKKRKRR